MFKYSVRHGDTLENVQTSKSSTCKPLSGLECMTSDVEEKNLPQGCPISEADIQCQRSARTAARLVPSIRAQIRRGVNSWESLCTEVPFLNGYVRMPPLMLTINPERHRAAAEWTAICAFKVLKFAIRICDEIGRHERCCLESRNFPCKANVVVILALVLGEPKQMIKLLPRIAWLRGVYWHVA